MSEETSIKEEPKLTEQKITIPDPAAQYQRNVARIQKTKTVKLIAEETIDGATTQRTIDTQVIPYEEDLYEGEGESAKPIMLSECVSKKVELEAKVLDAKATEKETVLLNDLKATFGDKPSDDDVKLQAKWGLGCFGNCGNYGEFKPTKDLKNWESIDGCYTVNEDGSIVCVKCGFTHKPKRE